MRKNKKANRSAHDERRERPTLLEFLAGCRQEIHLQLGIRLEASTTVRPIPLPEWGKRTLGKFAGTVLKPLLKLRQPRDRVDFQKFGKTVGVIIRGIVFFRHELSQIIAKDGLEKISDDDWERIQPSRQTRAYLTERLGRPVAKTQNLEDLAKESFEKQIQQWERMRDQAYQLMAHCNAKEYGLFLKGLEQGYGVFMDEDGQFCSNRGRNEIYLQLISSMHEIEKMRRMVPPKRDSDLYEHLKPWHRFSGVTDRENIHWLRDVCDDISLYMVGKRGRPSGRY